MNFQETIDFIRAQYPGKDFIPLHEPIFSGNEKKYVLDCIDSTYVSSVGQYVNRFEEMIRDYTGAKYAVAAVNGTAALHLALRLAGVSSGDQVLTQPLTFIATCNAISYCGAEPVFLDIDKKTLGLSADVLEQWLNEKVEIVERSLVGLEGLEGKFPQQRSSQLPKLSQPEFICLHKETGHRISACVPMHTFGHPCEIDRIIDICNRYNIPVIEDAAESLGSLYKDKHTGTYGLMGIISFNGNKTITTGGGGMIVTDDEKIGTLAKHLTTQAKKPHPWKFEHDYIGYNYRLPNINAALGCAQMERIDDYVKNKRELASRYQEFFDNKADFGFVTEPVNSRSNYWLNCILLENEKARDEFLKFSNDAKVMTRPCWTLMNKLPMFNHCLKSDISQAEEIETRLVNIPSSVQGIIL